MRRVYCFVATAALFGHAAQAQANEDGTWWASASANAQVYYVTGLTQGMFFMGEHSIATLCLDRAKVSTEAYNECYSMAASKLNNSIAKYATNVTYGQMQDGVTTLYSDYRNRKIPVARIWHVALRSIAGMPSADVEKWLEFLRSSAR